MIQDFSFDDGWFPATDGGGPSLVIRDATGVADMWDRAAGWRSSGLSQGSPGSDDPIDGGPPQVTAILASGSTWSGSFLTDLDVRGLGQGGYVLTPGSSAALPWSTIDRIIVEFSEPVMASAGQITLAGVNVGSYPVQSFELSGNRATWTLAAPIVADKLLLSVPGAITDTAGNPMGSDYTLRFDVHPGDVNIDAAVNRGDLVHNLLYQFTSPSLAEYDPLQDVDSNGRINILDWVRIRDRFGTSLPPGEPGGSPAAANAEVAVVSSGPVAPRRTGTKQRAIDIVFDSPSERPVGDTGAVLRSTVSRKATVNVTSTTRQAPADQANSREPLRSGRGSNSGRKPHEASRDAVFASVQQ
jgi:hypothetical protein